MADGEWSVASQGRVLCQHYIIHKSLKAGAQIRKIRWPDTHAGVTISTRYIFRNTSTWHCLSVGCCLRACLGARSRSHSSSEWWRSSILWRTWIQGYMTPAHQNWRSPCRQTTRWNGHMRRSHLNSSPQEWHGVTTPTWSLHCLQWVW